MLDPNGLIGCVPAVAPAGQVLPGTVCTYDSFRVSPLGQCPPSVPKKVGSQHVVLPPLVDQYQIFCALPNPAKAQVVALSPDAPAAPMPTQFGANGRRAQVRLGALNPKIFGILLDNTDPVVQLSTIVTPLGNGMGRLLLTANATDNVGVSKVVFVQSKTFSGGANVLATLTAPPYVWQSAPMLLTDIYGEVCGAIGCDSNYWYAVATDAAGNEGWGLAGAGAGAPVIDTFIATPAQVPSGGGSVVLSWGVQNAAHLFIDHGVGYVTGLSTIAVNVSVPTTFTLTAINSTANVTATTNVMVMPLLAPTIASFTATPASLPPGGGNVTLNWATTGATSVSIDNGLGVVTGTSKVVNVGANTTFTLTATNTSGSPTKQTNVVVATTVDRFVDPVAGLDTNACTQAAPCRTIGKAMTGAPSGSAVYLADGSYPGSNSATIPDGVALRATHPGAAILNDVTLSATGSASLNGLVFDLQGQSCSSINAASTTGTPTLAITGVLFKCAGAMNIGGSVKAVMTPGPLANGQYTALASLGASLLNLSGTAELLIQGGIIDFNNFGQGQYGPGNLNTTGSSKLTLDAVTVRNLKQQAFVIAGNTTVVLRNGTVIDRVGDVGDCAAGAAIVVSGGGTLTMDHAQVSNGPSSAICIGSGTTQLPTMQLSQSTISGMGGSAIATAQINSPNGRLTADGLALINNYRGMYLLSGTSPAVSVTLSNLTLTGNSAGGMTLQNGALTLRNSVVSNNGAEGGLTLYADVTTDLGTTASPGGNTFTGNTGPQLNSIVTAGQTVDAVGNTWKPNVQGADANGRYSLPPAYAPVPKAGPTNGSNFQIYNASTLNL